MSRPPKKSKDAYHHGDLRNSVIAAATTLVEKDGAMALTIRNIAARVGVSHAAVYHHFEDRTSILAAVAETGFVSLSHALDSIGADAGTALERFRRMGLAYVQFALRHPRLYEVMFGSEGAIRHAYPGLASAALQVFARIQSTIAQCQAEGLIAEGEAAAHTLFAWSAVHGLSSLIIAGQLNELDEEEVTPEALAELIVTRVFTGLAFGARAKDRDEAGSRPPKKPRPPRQG